MPTRRVVASRSGSDRRDAASDNAGSSQLAFEVVDATMICSAAVPAKKETSTTLRMSTAPNLFCPKYFSRGVHALYKISRTAELKPAPRYSGR